MIAIQPFMTRLSIHKILLACFLCWVPTILLGQARETVPSRPGDTVIWYEVKDGDTLSKITEQFLGIDTLWPENHRLNPHVRDPDLLTIGEKLRIISARELPSSKAEVEKVVRKVMRRSPRDNDWQNAAQGDVLTEKNEVQTYKRASTRLRFEDGAHLDIKEESLVFLRKVGQTLRGVERQTIEIKEGEAEIAQRGTRQKRSDIEIIVGDVFAKPTPDANGRLVTRTRRAADGQARVMVYDGNTQVNASGSQVAVPRGMGTFVDPGQAPAPPQKLLPAVRLSLPNNDHAFPFANPMFKWQAVPKAASYTFELCNDADCGTATFRQEGLQTTNFQSERLPSGSHFWRITAVSANSLDGFPSKARRFSIEGNRPDRLPPTLVALPVGAGSVLGKDQIVLGPGGSIQIHAMDDAAGVGTVEYRWNDGRWQAYQGQALTPPSRDTTAVLEVRASDLLDKQAQPLRINVSFDDTAPEPPSIERQ